MRHFVAAAVVSALFPASASAVITIRPSDVLALPGQTVAIEVYADPATLTPEAHEHLNAYAMTLSAVEFAGPSTPSFVVPANFTFGINSDPTHQYVFTAAEPPFDPASGSNGSRVLLSAAPGTADTDLTETRNGFGRITVRLPAFPFPIPGEYSFRIDDDSLSLRSSTGTIEAVGGTARWVLIPEPSAAGACAVAGAAVLLRRRPRRHRHL
jgi:hypothetical protein